MYVRKTGDLEGMASFPHWTCPNTGNLSLHHSICLQKIVPLFSIAQCV